MNESIKYFDVHSHIHGDEFAEGRDKVLERMREAGVATVAVGTDREFSRRAVDLADKEPLVYASVGIHPRDNLHDVFDGRYFRDLANHPKVVAIGECGLDFFRIDEGDDAEKSRQRDLFEQQIECAIALNKPLMIHARPQEGTDDAHRETLSILEQWKKKYPGLRANIHFFTSTLEIALRYTALGFTLSFPGVVTFKGELDSVLRGIPLDSILSETDSPYASPVPFRGQKNEPARVVEIVRYIGKTRPEGEDVVQEALLENARRFFGV